MEQELVYRYSSELQIAPEHIAREYWEMYVLKHLMESRYGKSLIFKGEAALRLAYKSPRFSEDMDFSLEKNELEYNFRPLVENIVRRAPELSITDLEEKYYTYLAEIKITEPFLNMPFRLKMEISRRESAGYDSTLILLSSPVSPFEVLGKTATLEQLLSDKRLCISEREKPRDIFDLWYISQRLSIPYEKVKASIPKRLLTQELRKYLPKNYWESIDLLVEE